MQKKYRIAAIVFLSLLLLYLAIPLNLDRFKDYSTMVLDNDEQILRVFLNDQEQWCLPAINDNVIPDKLETAVLIYEDRSFFYHPGINPWSILRAIYLNVKYDKVLSGGSTITMQVVRMASQNPRTFPYKILEIFQALKLEINYSKDQILKMYLNHAPYGRNIVGVRAASLKYFGREPENLTWSEAVTLAVLPNAPGLISPGKQQQKLITKRNRLLETLLQRGNIDIATCNLSKMEPAPDIVYSLPMLAPHLTRQAAKESDSSIIRTTLNKQIQSDTENILNQHAEYLQSIGINNICALICNTETGEIVAYCGSHDFWDSSRNGQVDGVQAARSSGSTLKPFLYALSMDEGILLPETRLNDVPTYFGAFSPENAEKKYDGLVTAHEALVRSLNVPAVRLLFTYGLVEFYESLKAAGISTLFRRSDDYGLTLIIGGAEATLFDLTGLYRGLGNEGRFSKLYWNKDNELKNETQIISTGASYLTLGIMQDLIRPGAEYYWHQYENKWPLAWKTGTSFGNRDAWAVGVNPEWTIGVWVGNFTGEGNPALSGAAVAGPILFDIFNSLPKDTAKNWFATPLQQTRVNICKDSGYLATENCPDKIDIWAPLNMKPLKFCPYHKKRIVNTTEKYTVCSQCWEEGNYHEKNTLEYPPIVAKYLRKRGQIVPKLLPHNPKCNGIRQDKTIEIIYPTSESVIYIPKDFGGVKQKVTIKIANRYKKSRIFWYLDSVYLGTTNDKDEMSLDILKGHHNLFITDEFGNDAEVSFKVISK